MVVAGPSSCQRRPASEESRTEPPRALAVDVLADTGRSERLRIVPPAAAVWMTRVAESRPVSPAPAPKKWDAPLPEAGPAALPVEPAPTLEIEGDLQPPWLRDAPPLAVPRGTRAGRVELDVRVDETGRVSDAEWAGGSEDSLLVNAAVRCALGMRFYPARQGGRPVAVWCRQRFDFDRARGVRAP